jgi:hypothetical protein
MILHKDRHFVMIHTVRGKKVGYQPFKKVIGKNIDFLCNMN